MKKFIVSMLLFLPLCLVAQEIKIAIVNTGEIFNIMPEMDALENETVALRQQFQNEMKVMEDEYTRKYEDFMAQGDSLTDNIKQLRVQEIEGIRSRMENFVPMAQEAIQKKQEELFAPIQEKLMKAIDSVGEENGYTCIMNPQVLLYRGKGVVDATDKVKAKLGLK